jgi:hypothetical protein
VRGAVSGGRGRQREPEETGGLDMKRKTQNVYVGSRNKKRHNRKKIKEASKKEIGR